MKFKDIIIIIICLVVATGMFITAGSQLDYINSQREKLNLIRNEPLENAPPSLAFATVAMGAFRGLVVDILWMRADRLKQEGQFFDAKQLAEWITTLQPRFAAVWDFQSWNMAYNISAAIPASEPDQRWRWVKNGYELLRDKGIPLNPRNMELYKSLAWIFQHKISGVTDDAHRYYKLQMALTIEPLLGDASNEYFEKLTQAPETLEKIMEDSSVAELLESLRESSEQFAKDGELVSSYLSLRGNPDRFPTESVEVIDDYRGTEALEKFDIFANAYQLRNEWKLEPEFMQQLNRAYGPIDPEDPNNHLPLDWRHPDSHAIYWAAMGLKKSSEKYDITEVNTDRIVVHSLQNLFRRGDIYIYETEVQPQQQQEENEYVSTEQQAPVTQYSIYLRPDLQMFEPYNNAMKAVLEKYKQEGRGGYTSLEDGHRNMLINAFLSFYQAGHKQDAKEIYTELRELYPREEFEVSMVEFARNRLREELESLGIHNAREIIEMMLREGYFRFSVHEDQQAYAREQMAKEVYENYQKEFGDTDRVDLPDFEKLRYNALVGFFRDPRYPPEMKENLLARIRNERPDLAEKLKEQEKKILEETENKQ